MIISGLTIENFGCFVQPAEFKFSNGINYIAGANGHGKSTILKAFIWLSEGDANANYVSAKAILQSKQKGKVKTSVRATFYDGKSKSYEVERSMETTLQGETPNSHRSTLTVIQRSENSGEREQVTNPDSFLRNNLLPDTLRKFMFFEGEAELQVLENTDSLTTLINRANHLSILNKASRTASLFLKEASIRFEKEQSKKSRDKTKHSKLSSDISHQDRLIQKYTDIIKEENKNIKNLKNQISKIEDFVEKGGRLNELKKRQEKANSDLAANRARIKDNLIPELFENFWILEDFEADFQKFTEKVTMLDKYKRKEEASYLIEIGKQRASAATLLEKLSDSIPLDLHVPGKDVLQELLDAEHCKVCNREAKKGSDAYEYMASRLKDILDVENITKEDEIDYPDRFEYDLAGQLIDLKNKHKNLLLKVRTIPQDKKDLLDLNEVLNDKVDECKRTVDNIDREIDNLIGTSASADTLSDAFMNHSTLHAHIVTHNSRKSDAEHSLKTAITNKADLIAQRDKLSTGNIDPLIQTTFDTAKEVVRILDLTKSDEVYKVIEQLESRANEIFEHINVESFRGNLKLELSDDSEEVDVQLIDDDSATNLLDRVNTSVQTSAHLSLLLSIIEYIGTLDQTYPVILDAPLSSFDPRKAESFYSTLNRLVHGDWQVIIASYEFLSNSDDGSWNISPDLSDQSFATKHWIVQRDDVDPQRLNTVESVVRTIP